MVQILIVEKDAALAAAWRRVLTAAGHEVAVAADGQRGLDLASELLPALAITEIILPYVGGVAFTGKVKLKDPTIKVIAVTGDPAALDRNVGALELAGRVGADLLLEKPIAPDALVTAVRQLLAQA